MIAIAAASSIAVGAGFARRALWLGRAVFHYGTGKIANLLFAHVRMEAVAVSCFRGSLGTFSGWARKFRTAFTAITASAATAAPTTAAASTAIIRIARLFASTAFARLRLRARRRRNGIGRGICQIGTNTQAGLIVARIKDGTRLTLSVATKPVLSAIVWTAITAVAITAPATTAAAVAMAAIAAAFARAFAVITAFADFVGASFATFDVAIASLTVSIASLWGPFASLSVTIASLSAESAAITVAATPAVASIPAFAARLTYFTALALVCENFRLVRERRWCQFFAVAVKAPVHADG